MGCGDDEPIITEAKVDYSFFVAGHTYGAPGINNIGLHPPFEDFYDTINTYPKLLSGFLTGDIVLASNDQNWDEVEASLQQLNMPIYFAYGNHDILWSRPLVEGRYGISYKAFMQENDLFILLDPNIDEWNISGDQLDFLTNTLDSLEENAEHIFVFFHQLIWWGNGNIMSNNRPNSLAGKADSLNYWTAVEPIFNALDKPVFLFAGDVGANQISPSLMYYKDGDITYISSGMGHQLKDNFLIIDVLDDESVRFKVKGLNCPDSSDCMGNIEDYPPL
ncbi:MAG: hypothetical protein ACJA1N_002449 [Saprospiraceae bacterium]|jgi:hypothetical protein